MHKPGKSAMNNSVGVQQQPHTCTAPRGSGSPCQGLGVKPLEPLLTPCTQSLGWNQLLLHMLLPRVGELVMQLLMDR